MLQGIKDTWCQWTETVTHTTKKVYKDLTLKPDKYKSVIEMVKDYDYPIEQYFYTTQDGYINRVHRICGPRGTQPGQFCKRPVIIYQHGLFDSSATACCDGLDSMAFFFAE